MKRSLDVDYSNSKMEYAINEYIHHKRDRLIMQLHFLDGLSADEIAKREDVGVTPKWVYKILDKRLAEISKYL